VFGAGFRDADCAASSARHHSVPLGYVL
jgi:hypothetical protein